MQATSKPLSITKVLLRWLLFLSVTLGVIALVLWHDSVQGPAEETPQEPVHQWLTIVIGALCAAGGVVAYFIILGTNCFTSNFQRPVFPELKGKLYVANIVVSCGLALGVGFAITPFTRPLLERAHISDRLTFLLPVMAMVVLFQVLQIFVLIWAPLERRLISRRLLAGGISPEQLQTARLVGLSDPTRSSFKKFAMIEDDIGALWFGPDQLVYCGDSQRFSILRPQLTQVERRADAGNNTMLGGITHVIVHVALPDGTERQIRFHTEGHWTMRQKGRAMDELEQQLLEWRNASAAVSGSPA